MSSTTHPNTASVHHWNRMKRQNGELIEIDRIQLKLPPPSRATVTRHSLTSMYPTVWGEMTGMSNFSHFNWISFVLRVSHYIISYLLLRLVQRSWYDESKSVGCFTIIIKMLVSMSNLAIRVTYLLEDFQENMFWGSSDEIGDFWAVCCSNQFNDSCLNKSIQLRTIRTLKISR